MENDLYFKDAMDLLLTNKNEISFYDEEKSIITEKLYFNVNWNWVKKDNLESRYGLFAISNVLLAKDIYNINTLEFDRNIINFLKYIYKNRMSYSKSDLTYGGLLALILGKKTYYLEEFDLKELEKLFLKTLNETISSNDNQDSLILISGKYLNDLYGNTLNTELLKKLVDKYLKSQNKKGFYETGDIRSIYHQRNMYILWGLAFATFYYPEVSKQIKKSFDIALNWAWNNRFKKDNAFCWHPAFYFIKNNLGIRIPIYNIKSSRFLFECHQTFFVNAINLYHYAFNSSDYQNKKEIALSWIFGKNRINEDLTKITKIKIPVRIMHLNGDLFIKNQNFKGSYEVGSYILALSAI
jgi:hypothetical protein